MYGIWQHATCITETSTLRKPEHGALHTIIGILWKKANICSNIELNWLDLFEGVIEKQKSPKSALNRRTYASWL